MFKEIKTEYEKALNKLGHKIKLNFINVEQRAWAGYGTRNSNRKINLIDAEVNNR